MLCNLLIYIIPENWSSSASPHLHQHWVHSGWSHHPHQWPSWPTGGELHSTWWWACAWRPDHHLQDDSFTQPSNLLGVHPCWWDVLHRAQALSPTLYSTLWGKQQALPCNVLPSTGTLSRHLQLNAPDHHHPMSEHCSNICDNRFWVSSDPIIWGEPQCGSSGLLLPLRSSVEEALQEPATRGRLQVKPPSKSSTMWCLELSRFFHRLQSCKPLTPWSGQSPEGSFWTTSAIYLTMLTRCGSTHHIMRLVFYS